MNRVIVDPVTRATLANAPQKVELCDDFGRVLGHFIPLKDYAAHIGPRINDEEIERRLRCGDGRSLAEILADLQKKA